MQTLAYRFQLTPDGLDVRLLADGREVGSTIVTPCEYAALLSGGSDPHAAVETADRIRSQMLPHGWPPVWVSLSIMVANIRAAWESLRVRTPGDAGTLPP